VARPGADRRVGRVGRGPHLLRHRPLGADQRRRFNQLHRYPVQLRPAADHGAPPAPYDAIRDNHTDPAREAVHPQHVSDVLHGLALLRSYGLTDQSYILSGHSCGACLAFQAILQPPRHYGLDHLTDAPCPAAMLGLNGLYDLPALVHGLGGSHEHLRDDYERMLSHAFAADQRTWPAASPAHFDPADIAGRVADGTAPPLVVLDQSTEDSSCRSTSASGSRRG
jgi:kynurenine formamidase